MAATQVIGRVAVRVLPDTDNFRKDAQRELDRIEQQLRFKVKLELDTADLTEQLRKLKKKIEDWRDKIDPLKIGVHLDLVTGQTEKISTRLAYLTRPRKVEIVPVLNKAGLAQVMTALAALSGGRVLGDFLTRIKDIGLEFDRWAPKIGAAALAIGGLGSVLLTSVSNISALTLSIAQMATAAFALPALFAGAAIGAGIVIVALTQMKAAVPDVFDQFKKLGQTIGKNFWAEAADGIRSLTTLYLPELGKTASGIGTFFGKMAEGLAGPFKQALPAMFENLNKAIGITTGNTDIFANIITKLGLTGSQYLPQFATWINTLSTQFSNFLDKASADGTLKQFIDAGIQGFKDMGGILLNVGKIIGDIGKAASLGGGSGLGMIRETLENIQKITSSPEFQLGLIGVFEAAHKVMSIISETAGPALLNFFSKLGDTFVAIAPAIGNSIGTALAAIANALASPAFTGAVVVVFNAIQAAIEALAPALPAVAEAFGALAPVVSALLGAIAPLITAALIPLSKVIQVLAPAIIPLINVLGNGLLNIITALSPVVVMLAQALAPIVTLLADQLALIMPSIVSLFGTLVSTLAPLIAQLLTGLAPVLPIIITAFGQLVEALIPLIPPLVQLLSAILLPLIPVIVQLAGSVFPVLVQVITILAQALVPVIELFTRIVTWLMPLVVGVFTLMATVITNVAGPVLTWLANVVKTVIGWIVEKANWLGDVWGKAIGSCVEDIKNFASSVNENVQNAIKFFQELPGKIGEVFSNAGTWLLDAGDRIIDGLIEGLKNGFNAVKETLGGLTDLLPDWKGPAQRDAVLLYDAGQLIIDGFVNGLESRYGAVKKSLAGLSNDVSSFNIAAPNASGIGAAVGSALDGGMDSGGVKVFNYYAAPGSSLGSEEDLFAATGRARMVGW